MTISIVLPSGVIMDVKAQPLFTARIDTFLTVPPGDCPWAIVVARTPDQQDVLGLIHLSREKLDSRFVGQAIDHVETKYGVDVRDIQVGITPGISKRNYTWQPKNLNDPESWDSFLEPDSRGLIHVDFRGYALEQFRERGVRQISVYSNWVCTSAAAARGEADISRSFAYRKGREDAEKRILVAARLRDSPPLPRRSSWRTPPVRAGEHLGVL